MDDIKKVYEVNWQDYDGLWDNNNKIAIHWPIFCLNYLNNENVKLKKNHLTEFYISYDRSNNIKNMNFYYYDLNDIVFYEKTWEYLNKARVFTTIKPF